MRVFTSFDEFAAQKGEHLGYSDWHVVDQDRINLFAEATGDHQWIHVDPERAKDGPFGATIAHGYLTLSMIPALGKDVFRLEGPKMLVNYGSEKVRFPTPVTVGSRVRVGAELVDVRDVAQGKQVLVRYTVEIDGQSKPACVAETLVLVVL
ncbi:MaoC family dehydratase [Yinghuangia sp. ASG 101]|uniref:MaoC family dehydratase n=1 Tax=Yinghuangia sp. ASG 101 TaxID=2896848 RepID=UPI001E6195C2|nr:MaoC family dehydratase [Yinghuangia sp. ASG 101]UGQ13147.1 MaoC family dehydratase [Yinghuangia sp. ASG 101]